MSDANPDLTVSHHTDLHTLLQTNESGPTALLRRARQRLSAGRPEAVERRAGKARARHFR